LEPYAEGAARLSNVHCYTREAANAVQNDGTCMVQKGQRKQTNRCKGRKQKWACLLEGLADELLCGF
jgi:hypothetical protein